MDATLVWTAVGSGAGVAAVAVAIGIAVVQARSGRRHPLRVVVEKPGRVNASAGVTVLRPPTGRLPEYVRGREDLLALLRVLAGAPDGQVHVLAGLGGTGKSTVALQLAEEMTRAGGQAWWVPAADAGTVTAKLLGLARELGALPAEVAEALNGRRDPADLLWRFLEARRRWLLVFDNADDLHVLTVGGNDAIGGAGWLRSSQAGLIVVTSREHDPRAWGRHAELHEVSSLDAATGAKVLTDLVPEAGPMHEAAALSDRLGGLPLALRHAGSQLSSEFGAVKSFGEYLRALDDRFGQLMGHGAEDNRETVTSTWELSLDAMATWGRPQARPLLRVLSCLAPAVLIPAALVDLPVLGRVCEGDENRAEEGLAALASAGLITTTADTAGTRPGLIVHPLVTETSRMRLDAGDTALAGGVAVALLKTAAAGLRYDQPRDWPAWVQLVPHLNAVYGYLASRLTDDDLATLTSASESAAAAFMWAGSYLASRELAQSALRHAARLGADHPAVLSLRYRITNAHVLRGEYTEAQAEQEFRDMLTVQMQRLGPNHPSTLTSRYQIAKILGNRGFYELAEREHRDVLAARLRVLGPDHPNTLTSRYQIACMLADRGLYEEAELEFRDVLRADIRINGPDHPSTLTSRYQIARMLAGRGFYEQAEREYRDVLAARLRILGPDHPVTRTTQQALTTLTKADVSRPTNSGYAVI